MTTKHTPVSNDRSWLASLATLAALATSGCFRSPTVDVATMTCQQDVECPSGYVCKVKGVPGGCCRPDDTTCGSALDGSTLDLPLPIDTSSAEGSGGRPEASVDLVSEHPQPVDVSLDLAQTSPDVLPDAVLPADTGQPDGQHDVPITSDVGQDSPTTPDALPDVRPDSPTTPDTGPDTGRADLGCTVVSPGTCCTSADCTSGGVGTVAACNAGVCTYGCDATHKACGDACIPKANCCTNADCSGATPQCSAGTCVGGVLSITPTTHSFGSVVVGDQSTASTFVVSNTGAGSTGTLTAVVAGTAEFAMTTNGCAGASLTAGTSCNISVRFAPTSVGAKAATLQVSGTPGGSISSTLQGTGQAPAALTIEPPSYVFPTTITGGSTSTATTFTVRNAGSVAAGTTVGLAASLSGANASEFAISTNTCTGSLGPGVTCTVAVAFKPALLSSGAKAATLSVTASPGGSATANLAATAQECDTSTHCTVPNRPLCISNVCRGCSSGTDCTASGSTYCDACLAKNTTTRYCDFAPASPMYDRCVECNAQITCNERNAYCSPTTKTCVPCTQAPDPDHACDQATSAAYDHCVLTGDQAGQCIHAQCTTANCDSEEYPGLPYCVNCTCSATPGTPICP